MKLKQDEIRKQLSDKGLRITPQRTAVMVAIHYLGNHPTADQIIDHVRKSNPNIATGTVYSVLDTLTDHGLVKRVTTDMKVMRYDDVVSEHHHLYCTSCDVIEDYTDEELDEILRKYFKNKEIKGFHLQEISVQIKGTFDKC